jgi:Raf kinase inhibitor-like YbhB/YbcL family protein
MRRRLAIGSICLVVLVGACGPSSSGSASSLTASPAVAQTPSATATSVGPSAAPSAAGTSVVPPSPAGPFAVSSPAFADGAAIQKRFTCDGASISPEIDWSGAPAATQALALTVIDPDAGGFVHWLVYNIPAAPSGSLAENIGTSAGAPPQGSNGRGNAGYTGPCPPSGTHHYVFTLYGIDRTLGLTGTPSRADIETAIKGHVLAKTVLTGTYKRS